MSIPKIDNQEKFKIDYVCLTGCGAGAIMSVFPPLLVVLGNNGGVCRDPAVAFMVNRTMGATSRAVPTQAFAPGS